MCSIPFPKVTRQKSHSSLRTKEYGIESRIQPHGNMGAGEWRMPSSAFISPSQFYCVCLASGSRCEILFWGGFCGILSPHHRYIHLSSEAVGIDLSYLTISRCIFSFIFSLGEEVGYSLHCSILGNFSP